MRQEAIELIVALKGHTLPKGVENAYNRLCKAITEAEKQEPVAWMWRCKPYCDWPNWSVSLKRPADSGRDGHERTEGYEDIPLYTTPQPQQDAWKNAAIRLGEELSSVGPDGYYNMTAEQWLDWAMDQQPRGKNSLSQPQQQPVKMVAYNCKCGRTMKFESVNGIVAPQREWVGLTDEDEIDWEGGDLKSLVKAIEAKLKEKNQ